ncbi:MAG: NotI family restriction endonuclease [Planctomycetota bacterium]|nr:NotI family restriction endonuclease [Planctomycetota bacterium]
MTSVERRQLAEIALTHGRHTFQPCLFRNSDGSEKCIKKGGICSLRLYEDCGDGSAVPVIDVEGDLRTVCPQRFKQDGIIYKAIGERILKTSEPKVVSEIRFLRRFRNESFKMGDDKDSNSIKKTAREDVGNIDNVLVHPKELPMKWCALEIQAVYFSGMSMNHMFSHIKQSSSKGIPFPDAVRRPDYRSSGPKRLMPQLQIKVPTLRRWGKKMAVVVDEGFYRSLGEMDTVSDLSNSDIAWFVIRYDENGDIAKLIVDEPKKQTLECAVEGLTGGLPVSLGEFEAKIREKINQTLRKQRRNR